MTLVQQTDHSGLAASRWTDKFRDQPLITAFLDAFIQEVQEAEDALWSLRTGRFLANAMGVQLDVIGKIVGRDRKGLDDDDYRAVLFAWIRANRSNGTGNDILDVLTLALGSTFDMTLEGKGRASFVVDLLDPLLLDPTVVAELIKKSRLGGVKAHVIYSDLDSSELFTFASGSTPEADTARGFGRLLNKNLLTANQRGFENGDLTDFTVDSGSWSAVSTNPERGTYHAQCSAAGSGTMKTNAVSCKPNTKYTISGYVAGSAASIVDTLSIQLSGNVSGLLGSGAGTLPSTTYARIFEQGVTTGPSDSTMQLVLDFVNNSFSINAYFDTLQIEESETVTDWGDPGYGAPDPDYGGAWAGVRAA